jgi:hypothetical protein
MFVSGSVAKLIGLLVPLLFVCILFDIQGSRADAAPSRHCSETIPTAIQKIIQQRYSGFHIRTKKDSMRGCPGIVKVNFYGDGRTVYAVVIQQDHDNHRVEGKLLLASKQSQSWKVEVLDEGDGVGSIWHGPAEEFDDMYRGRTQVPKGDIIVYFGYESWARAYGWTGEKIEVGQLTD